ncbi:MAG: nitrilase-related carbon-nitrogen hydrolase [Planctomycetota bacterium]|nr:nitrilase-related carbon-nitrogen hydrolase [Planctomycetota bacterium]
MRVHLVQLDCVWEDRDANRRRVAAMLDDAEVGRGDLVVLPEMFDTGFSFRLERTADTDGTTLAFLQTQASQRGVWLVGSRSVLDAADAAPRGRNRCSVIGPDGTLVCEYDKVHPFSLGTPGVSRESDLFVSGMRVATTRLGAGDDTLVLCPTICYDLRFPELYREGLRQGAELFTVIANWPDVRAFHFRTLCIARAIENQAFVLAVNRCGKDPSLSYHGGSMIISPLGEVLAEADGREQVLSGTMDVATLRAWRDRFPAWRDRRL